MREAIRFSQKLSGALVIEITSVDDDVYQVVHERGIVVPAVEQSPGRWVVDDEYLADVQSFIASVKKPPRPRYVHIDDDGTMTPAEDDPSIPRP